MFRVFIVAAVALLLYGLYRLRVASVTRDLNTALSARMAERMRIARDLHDTLLQTFHGALMKFQAATSLLPAQPVEARHRLEDVMQQAEKAIAEGRDAVHGLREPSAAGHDLAADIEQLGKSLLREGAAATEPDFQVIVEGDTRALPPHVHEEVKRISHEALRNAFQHARAGRIDVRIHYGVRQFELRVVDDGVGIPADVLGGHARPGHFGLRGMEERAHLAGGTLTFAEARGRGTQLTLAIPASIAYAKPRMR